MRRQRPGERHAAISSPDRIVLVDPGNFTMPYDLALAGAIAAEGRHVRLFGQAGEVRPQPLYHGHFYPILTSSLGRLLPAAGKRLIKGACHGHDMLRLLRRVAAFGAGIVHFQWSPLPVIDLWAIRWLRRRVPVVLTLHDSNPYQGHANWLMRQGYAGLLTAVDAIIVHTRQAQQRVMARGIDPLLIHRMPHGLLNDGGDAAVPKPRRLPHDRLVLLQFGRIKPYKGIDLLLNALDLIPAELRHRLEVRIVGDPHMNTAAMEKFVRDHRLAGCVTLRFEFVSDAEAERLFAEADAVLLPYREIDASGVAMSAVARGVPVLATAVGGFRELFEGNAGAHLVPAADAAALAGAIVDWISDPARLTTLADAMRRQRASIPGWDEIACRHFAVYAAARACWSAEREAGAENRASLPTGARARSKPVSGSMVPRRGSASER